MRENQIQDSAIKESLKLAIIAEKKDIFHGNVRVRENKEVKLAITVVRKVIFQGNVQIGENRIQYQTEIEDHHKKHK